MKCENAVCSASEWQEAMYLSPGSRKITQYLPLGKYSTGRHIYGFLEMYLCSNIKAMMLYLCKYGIPFFKIIVKLVTGTVLLLLCRWKAPHVANADYLWLPFVDKGTTLNITFVSDWHVKDY